MGRLGAARQLLLATKTLALRGLAVLMLGALPNAVMAAHDESNDVAIVAYALALVGSVRLD